MCLVSNGFLETEFRTLSRNAYQSVSTECDYMSRRTQGQATMLHVLLLASFGVGMILIALYVFCLLSGPEFLSCTLDVINPF